MPSGAGKTLSFKRKLFQAGDRNEVHHYRQDSVKHSLEIAKFLQTDNVPSMSYKEFSKCILCDLENLTGLHLWKIKSLAAKPFTLQLTQCIRDGKHFLVH
jgi:hypothetical protein